jgi:AhpD family alkylhydroperoxidase
MNKRINFNRVQPKAYDAMDALDTFLNETSISAIHKELIKIRASQINGCAYCVDAHSHNALKLGRIIAESVVNKCMEGSRRYFFKRRKIIVSND